MRLEARLTTSIPVGSSLMEAKIASTLDAKEDSMAAARTSAASLRLNWTSLLTE